MDYDYKGLREHIADNLCRENGHQYEKLTTVTEERVLNNTEVIMFCYRCGDMVKIKVK